MTWLLTEGLVQRGHDVTLFATGDIDDHRATLTPPIRAATGTTRRCGRGSCTRCSTWRRRSSARPSSTSFTSRPPTTRCRWRFARLCPVPLLQTLHHSPSPEEVRAVVALSGGAVRRNLQRAGQAAARAQRRRNACCTAIDTESFTFSEPARRLRAVPRPLHRRQGRAAGDRNRESAPGSGILLAAPEDEYYHAKVAPHVDGKRVVYVGEVGHAQKVALLGGARAHALPRAVAASRSAWCSPKPWPAGRRWPRSIAARSGKWSRTA